MAQTGNKYNLKNKTVIVYDRGNYVEVAIRLAKEFGRVLYYMPSSSPFATFDSYVIGTGIPEIERIYDFWAEVDNADLIYFCDIYDGGLAEYLKSKGKLVYGSGYGEELELDRVGLLKHLEAVGLPVGKYEVVKGLSALKKHLKDKQDKYIKVSFFRGDFETFHFENYDLSKPYFDMLEHKMGLVKEDIEFVVCDPIDPAVEIGSDLISVNGKYASKGTWGIEIKDCGFAMKLDDYKRFPKQILEVNNKLEATLESYGYTGSVSTEVRVPKDGKAYLGDITCRQPQPPTSLQMVFYDNWAEMAYGAAMGEIVEPVTWHKYGAQAIIYSEWANREPQAIYFPQEIGEYVKIKNMCIRDGVYYYVPCHGVEMCQIGAVVFASATLEDAILEVKYMAKQVKGYDIKIKTDALDDATKEINGLKEFSIIKAF